MARLHAEFPALPGQPAWGQVRVSEALKQRGLSISPAGVCCVWQRHDLTSMKHRLKALEAKAAQDGILLTEAQIAALEKAKADKEAHGEFDSECPGYCGAQDTFYVGTLKGVGRSISRPSSIPTPKSPLPSCMTARPRSPPPADRASRRRRGRQINNHLRTKIGGRAGKQPRRQYCISCE